MSDQDELPDFQLPFPDKYKPEQRPDHNERWVRTREGTFSKEPRKEDDKSPERVR